MDPSLACAATLKLCALPSPRGTYKAELLKGVHPCVSELLASSVATAACSTASPSSRLASSPESTVLAQPVTLTSRMSAEESAASVECIRSPSFFVRGGGRTPREEPLPACGHGATAHWQPPCQTRELATSDDLP